MQNYAEIMFTPAVAELQDRDGTRALYAEKYPARTKPGFGPDEKAFLETRTSIYMASVTETGWPYVQHRGGPMGFLKVLDDTTLGFADYRGNRQHISEGNLSRDDRVSIFAMDYPNQSRLKLQGHARMIDADTDPELAAQLATPNQGRVERLTTIRIVAMDWNCPQFISPRYTQDEVAQRVAPHLAQRDAKIAELTKRLQDLGETP